MTYSISQARREDSETMSINLVKKTLLTQDGWFKTVVEKNDFGIDVLTHLAKKINKNLVISRKIIGFQLKSGISYNRLTNCDANTEVCAKFTDNFEKLKNWLEIWIVVPYPVYIVYLPNPTRDPDTAYWISIRDLLKNQPDLLESGNSLIFRFPKGNQFTKEQMNQIKDKILSDISDEKIREIPREHFPKVNRLLELYEEDPFSKHELFSFLEHEDSTQTIIKKDDSFLGNFGFRTGIPKDFSSNELYFEPSTFDNYYQEQQISDIFRLINQIIRLVSKSDSFSLDSTRSLQEVISDQEKNSKTNYVKLVTTVKGMLFLRNNRLIKMQAGRSILKDTNIEVLNLIGKSDLFFKNSFFLLIPNEILGRRKTIKSPRAKLQTFNPTDKYPPLLDIDPKTNFELVFDHIVEYSLFKDKIDRCFILYLEK